MVSDAKGVVRALLGMEEGNVAALSLADKTGTGRVEAMVGEKPWRLLFRDPKGVARLSVAENKWNQTTLELAAADGHPRLVHGVSARGSSFVMCRHPEEKLNMTLGMGQDGVGKLTMEKDGKTVWTVPDLDRVEGGEDER
jgi:hypothetical protein